MVALPCPWGMHAWERGCSGLDCLARDPPASSRLEKQTFESTHPHPRGPCPFITTKLTHNKLHFVRRRRRHSSSSFLFVRLSVAPSCCLNVFLHALSSVLCCGQRQNFALFLVCSFFPARRPHSFRFLSLAHSLSFLIQLHIGSTWGETIQFWRYFEYASAHLLALSLSLSLSSFHLLLPVHLTASSSSFPRPFSSTHSFPLFVYKYASPNPNQKNLLLGGRLGAGGPGRHR